MTAQKKLITRFIHTVWNHSDFSLLPELLHPAFTDHSLPPALSPDAAGLQAWVLQTGHSFRHHTHIIAMVAEGEEVMIKINLELEHIGTWRDIPPTGKKLTVTGYRYFKLEAGKIIGHWGMVDGNAIENQLRGCTHGCKVQV